MSVAEKTRLRNMVKRGACAAAWLAALLPAHANSKGEAKAPVTPKSCRLANSYSKPNMPASWSEGIIVNGRYPETATEADCEKKCRAEESGRKDDTKYGYIVKVKCYFGEKLVFEAEHK